MVIRESVEILREGTTIEEFKKEIDLLKSMGYEAFEENKDYVIFYQKCIVIN